MTSGEKENFGAIAAGTGGAVLTVSISGLLVAVLTTASLICLCFTCVMALFNKWRRFWTNRRGRAKVVNRSREHPMRQVKVGSSMTMDSLNNNPDDSETLPTQNSVRL